MKLYISTPINARSERTFKEKFIAAKHRSEILKEVIQSDPSFNSVSEIVTSFDICPLGSVSEGEAIGRCIQAVYESDAIYLDHAWQSSKGCNLEYRAAKIYGKEIFEHDKL